MYILGFDIGGTKCAVNTANWDGEIITLLEKKKCDTDHSVSPQRMIEKLIGLAEEILTEKPERIGISCGGPLDSKRGIIKSPPNLPISSLASVTDSISTPCAASLARKFPVYTRTTITHPVITNRKTVYHMVILLVMESLPISSPSCRTCYFTMYPAPLTVIIFFSSFPPSTFFLR